MAFMRLEDLKPLLKKRFDLGMVNIGNKSGFDQVVDCLMIAQLVFGVGAVKFGAAQL